MVMQRDTLVSIWGNSKPNHVLKIVGSWGDKVTTISDFNGNWEALLKTTHDIGPFSLSISTIEEKIIINDVLMGEVWLAAGQSNMEMNFDYCCNTTDRAEFEILNANYTNIRMFNVKKQYSLTPSKEVNGYWSKAVDNSIINFSAVGYFFSKWR